MDDTNKAIQDYALLPSPSWSGRYLTLSDVLLDRLKVVRAKNIEALTPEIKKILAMSSRSALAKKEPQKKREKLGRAKAQDVHVRR